MVSEPNSVPSGVPASVPNVSTYEYMKVKLEKALEREPSTSLYALRYPFEGAT